ncbi:hypothetical protein Tco_1243455 [Tanacetum coccineum]
MNRHLKFQSILYSSLLLPSITSQPYLCRRPLSSRRLPTPKGQTVGSFRKGQAMLPKAISEKLGSRVKLLWKLIATCCTLFQGHDEFLESAEVNFFSEYGEGSRYKFEKVKGHAPKEFVARNDLVQALHRIQALPDGAAAAPKPSGGG